MRRHYYFIIVLSFLIVIRTLPFEFTLSEIFRPDNWSEMSFAVGAATLTLVGIITSIVVSNENDRRNEFIEHLTFILGKLKEKARINPDITFNKIYDNSQEKLKIIIDERLPMKYSEGIIGILSFYSFLISALLALEGYNFKWIYFAFLLGITLLAGYVTYCIEEFYKIDRFSSMPEKKGNIALKTIKINGQNKLFDPKSKDPVITFTNKIKRMEFRVGFEGKVRNGFFHAIIRYTNGYSSHIPEPNTYLGDFVFADGWILTISPDKRLDTGILQKIGQPVEVSFEVCKDISENLPIGETEISTLGKKKIHRFCSLPEKFIVDSIELRVYEDPLFKSSYKRRQIDLITVHIEREEKIKK